MAAGILMRQHGTSKRRLTLQSPVLVAALALLYSRHAAAHADERALKAGETGVTQAGTHWHAFTWPYA